jgi:hypothetical protein
VGDEERPVGDDLEARGDDERPRERDEEGRSGLPGASEHGGDSRRRLKKVAREERVQQANTLVRLYVHGE